MGMPEDYRLVLLGRMIRDMPVGMTLTRALGNRWVVTYRSHGGPYGYFHGYGYTPEEALRGCLYGYEQISRDLWLEEAEQRGEE